MSAVNPCRLGTVPPGEADGEEPCKESPVRLCSDRQQASTRGRGSVRRGDDHRRARQNQTRHAIRVCSRVAQRDRRAAVNPQSDLLEAEMVLQGKQVSKMRVGADVVDMPRREPAVAPIEANVIALVTSDGSSPPRFRAPLQHRECAVPFAVTGRFRKGINDEAATVLDQQMPEIAQHRGSVGRLAIQPGVRVGRRFMRVVRSFLTPKIGVAIATPRRFGLRRRGLRRWLRR